MAPITPEQKPVLGSVAIVGAGISGLAAAYRLRAEGVAVTVFEADDSIGGKIKTVSQDSLVWEKGPNTMTESDPEVRMIISDLQLREKQQFPAMQKKRYIVKDGRPELLPSNPLAFLCSRLLSSRSKLNVVLEPLMWRRKKDNKAEDMGINKAEGFLHDESVADFLERHFSREIVDYIVDPFVAGTSGSDPDSISARYAFPDLWELEKSHGSLLIGAIKSGLARRKATRMERKLQNESKLSGTGNTQLRGSFSFVGGLQTLANSLAGRVGKECFKFNAPVLSLACNQQGNPLRDNWTLSYLKKAGKKEQRVEQHFDSVIMTAPLHNFREMQVIKDGKPYALDFIPQVIYQPMSVLVLSFEKEDVKRPLQGFGILVPSKEKATGFQTLGTIFYSSMFPDRAPSNHMVFTTFIGGSRNRDLASCPLNKLKEIAIADLQRLVGVDGKPVSVNHTFWSKAFPQYSLGYGAVYTALEKLEDNLPGFYYAGSHKGGLSVGKALLSGYNAAGEVLKYLHISGGRKLYTMASLEH